MKALDDGSDRRDGKTQPLRRRLSPEERLPLILAAALEEFAEKGFDGASMAGAAARAGVAKGLVYHYFPTKPVLFVAVMRSAIQTSFAEAEALKAAHRGTHEDLLRQMIEGSFARAVHGQDAVLFRLLLDAADRFPEIGAFYHQEVMAPSFALFLSVVQAGVEAGEFRTEILQDDLAAVLLAPVVLSSVWRAMLGPERAPKPEAMCRAHLDLILNGLRPR